MKRLLSILLSLALCVGLLPTLALAAPESAPAEVSVLTAEDGAAPVDGTSAPAAGAEAREPLADRNIHNSILIDEDAEDGYEGDYVVIYNPSTVSSKSCSTGTLTGLIETTVGANGQADPGEPDLSDDGFPYYRLDVDARLQELAKKAEPAPAPKDVRKSYNAGDKKTFSIYADYSPTGDSSVEFKCLYVGSHCYIWTPTSTASNVYPLDSLDSSFARKAANEFDAKFDLMQSSFGNHTNGSNGDGKVHLLYYNISDNSSNGSYVAGFFYSTDLTNNGLPMLNIDTFPGIHYTDTDGVVQNKIEKSYNVMVHEYQHLINHSNTSTMDKWLNESFSAAAEEICYPGSSVVKRIQHWEGYYYSTNDDWLSPPTEFMYNSTYYTHRGYSMYAWSNDLYDVLAQYGQVSLFAQYLYTRFGNTIYRQISDNLSDSTVGAITAATGVNCADLVRDFRVAVTANATLDQYGGIYGFKAQTGYKPADYHNVQNPYSLLAPIVFTGKSCSIKGGGAITVKPVNGVYNPPSDASSELRYIGVGLSRLVSGEVSIPTCSYENEMVTAELSGHVAQISTSQLHYQWQKRPNSSSSWSNISGATGKTYQVKSADIYRDIRVVVTADGYTGSLISGVCYCTDSIPLTSEYFPDYYLRQYLNDKFNTNGNSVLEGSEISRIYELHLNVYGENYYHVASLEGVQYLCELQDIYANHTQITSFDGTGVDLYTLDLSECPLESLNLSDNDQLRKLYLSDLTGSLSTLDLSNLRNLMVLETYGCRITHLDISQNPYLVEAALYGEEITYSRFKTYQIDRYNYLSTDDGDHYVTVAHFDEAFPNDRLRSWLQDDRNINWDGNNDLSIAEAKDVKTVDVGDEMEAVTDLTGVELLPNLNYLAAFNCEVEEVDLSRNTKLGALDLDNCKIDYLDVSNNTALQWMYCCRNGLGDLILGSNDVMYMLYASENYLIDVDVSGLPELKYLELDTNLLWALDVTNNPALEYLNVYCNYLAELDVSQNKNLKNLQCSGNSINKLDISACPKLVSAFNGTREEVTDQNGNTYWRYKDADGNVLCVDKETVVIAAHPANQTLAVGKTAKFTVKAAGEGMTYQWYYKTPNGSWTKSTLTGNKTASLSVPVTAARNGYQYKCRLSCDMEYVYSKPATLKVKTTITAQPTNKSLAVGKTAKFTVTATGAGLTYQWYYKTPNGSWTKSTLTGNKTAVLSVPVTAARNGYQYKCLIKDANGAKTYSAAAKLTVKITITAQPTDKSLAVGKTAKFTVTATGAGLTYQWYYKTPNGSWTKSTLTGNKTATLSVPVTAARNGYQYKCLIKDANGAKTYSAAAKLTVKITITAQPADKTLAAGKTAKFTVSATGAGLTYQWYYKTPSGSWTKSTLTGSNTATLTVKATAARNGYQYKCLIKDANCAKLYSAAAKLTVK